MGSEAYWEKTAFSLEEGGSESFLPSLSLSSSAKHYPGPRNALFVAKSFDVLLPLIFFVLETC